ncbi:TlpA family protein disulfide reductase, partial [bacterium]
AQGDLPTGVQNDQPFPLIKGVDLSGEPVNLERVLGKKTVVLSFWSIYCTDCVKELDDLRILRREFPEDDLEVVAVNTDSALPLSRITNFIRRYESVRGSALEVTHLVDRDSSVVNTLGIRYIPLMITVGKSGAVSSVMSGYQHDQDRGKLLKALDEGRIALGAWSEGLRGRLRTILRTSAAGGQAVEWGTFRVEEKMDLFGIYDKDGWKTTFSQSSDRDAEAERVECVVKGQLKVSLMREALSTIGFRVAQGGKNPFQLHGVEIPQCQLDSATDKMTTLYKDLSFDSLFNQIELKGMWIEESYWAGLTGDVDLGALREKVKELGLGNSPKSIEVVTTSDYDFKPLAVLKRLAELSYRVSSIRDDRMLYYGTAEKLVEELMKITIKGMSVYAERLEDGVVRLECF